MTAPRHSRRRVLVELRRLQGVVTRADVKFCRSRDWSSKAVEAVRRALGELEAALVGKRKRRAV